MNDAQILAENESNESKSIILSILAKLTVIKSYDFGIHCFSTLKKIMKSGEEPERFVLD